MRFVATVWSSPVRAIVVTASVTASMTASVAIAGGPLTIAPDPAPGLAHGKPWVRNLDCERVTAEAGSQRYPGQIVVSKPRGDYIERSAIICRERLTRPGLRVPRDEAVLSSLEATVTDLTGAAASLRPDLEERTWLVEAYFPTSATMSSKIAFAAKNALMRRGLQVSDRRPMLAAADVDVLSRLPPDEAFPAACGRYFASGALKEDDALLGVVSRDPRETLLHVGLCSRGQWMWLK